MDLIETTEGKGILMDLKYCERCGGLFIRPRGSCREHCGGCQIHLEERPPRKQRRRMEAHEPESVTLEGCVHIGCVLGFADVEVRA